jgi:hypothetical protein
MKTIRRSHPNTIPGKRFDPVTKERTSVLMGTYKGYGRTGKTAKRRAKERKTL